MATSVDFDPLFNPPKKSNSFNPKVACRKTWQRMMAQAKEVQVRANSTPWVDKRSRTNMEKVQEDLDAPQYQSQPLLLELFNGKGQQEVDEVHTRFSLVLQGMGSRQTLLTDSGYIRKLPVKIENRDTIVEVFIDDSNLVGRGGYGGVYRGICADERYPLVAVKVPRAGDNIRSDSLKKIEEEEEIWRGLRHPNILRFLGVYKSDTPGKEEIFLMSPIAAKGNLEDYVKSRPKEPKIPMIQQMAQGLHFMHMQDFVHGDIKATNALVSSAGIVQLCDFGFTKARLHESRTCSKHAGSLLWKAPEILFGRTDSTPVSSSGSSSSVDEDLADVDAIVASISALSFNKEARDGLVQGALKKKYSGVEMLNGAAALMEIRGTGRTFETDVYALGITISQVLSGNTPYDGRVRGLSDVAFSLKVITGMRPEQRPDRSDLGYSFVDLWQLAADCWTKDPEDRPVLDAILRRLSQMTPEPRES